MYQHDVDDENPYGTSVLHCVYWPWMFKKAGYEFWLMATEKFSVKTLLALFELNANDDALRERAATIADLLEGVISGTGAAVGNVKDIKEISGTGNVSEFAALVDACDVQIAYGLTSQSVATNNPDKGTQALGAVSADLLYGDAKGVALELQAILQTAVNWAVELNFGKEAAAPALEFDVERKADFTELMSAIEKGIPVSRSALYDQYKLPRPRDEEDSFVKPEPAAGFGLADGDDLPAKKKVSARRSVTIR
jgi:phage gp29-like protein